MLISLAYICTRCVSGVVESRSLSEFFFNLSAFFSNSLNFTHLLTKILQLHYSYTVIAFNNTKLKCIRHLKHRRNALPYNIQVNVSHLHKGSCTRLVKTLGLGQNSASARCTAVKKYVLLVDTNEAVFNRGRKILNYCTTWPCHACGQKKIETQYTLLKHKN